MKQESSRLEYLPLENSKRTRVLRVFLFKRAFPLELALAIIVTTSFINVITLKISAISLTGNLLVSAASLVTPTPVEPSEVIPNAYATEDVIYQENFNYARALRIDAEREYYLNLVQGNQRIVEAVYTFAKDLNKDLVFALILQESGANPKAYNENINKITGEVVSIDRGVFQLNSKSYPNLTEADFFHIETNVKYGVAHLRGELEYWNGNIRKALWTYNAGRNGISDGVPTRTITYAQSIIASVNSIKAEKEWYIKQSLIKYQQATLVAIGKE
jgi:soluble lytic murein transglycosylase-like protein